ncbi:hypothetical protein TNCV_1289341 [Trichonephila clavipes]|nr:hypothetical protein TNCV_1289341 [Trichonephila clavipes]
MNPTETKYLSSETISSVVTRLINLSPRFHLKNASSLLRLAVYPHISPKHSSKGQCNRFLSLSPQRRCARYFSSCESTPCLCTRPVLFVSLDRGCLDVFLPSIVLFTPRGNRLLGGLSSEVNLLSVVIEEDGEIFSGYCLSVEVITSESCASLWRGKR